MKANNKAMLYEAVSEFIQLHAFDHLLDNELAQLKSLLNAYTVSEEGTDLQEITSKLIPLLSKVNFFVESISPAAILNVFNTLPSSFMMYDKHLSNPQPPLLQ